MKNILVLFTIILSIMFVDNYLAQTKNEQRKFTLQKLSKTHSLQWKKNRVEAEVLASKMGIPIRQTYTDGRIIELQKYENGIPKYYETNNINSAYSISTDKVWPGGISGFSLTGKDILLGEWDVGGILTTHREFTGRATQKDVVLTTEDHSTHVAGTMIAAGIEPNARGMAYQANLDAYDWNNDEAEMAAAAEEGLLVSNHSYGIITGWNLGTNDKGDKVWYWFGDATKSNDEDINFGYYSSATGILDTISYNAPNYLIVKSAGNDLMQGPQNQPVQHYEFVDTNAVLVSTYHPLDGGSIGYDCLPEGSCAKNILTVGSVWDIPGGYSNPNGILLMQIDTTLGSSCGPTDDGRIKPDIVANGTGLYSSIASANDAYKYFSGTSMSSPSVAGSVGLLLEHQKKLHPNKILRSSTMKAIIIHTADEAGENPGPDYKFGWGLMNTYKAADFITKNSVDDQNYVILERAISTGEVFELPIQCSKNEYLKATICWTDVPGTPVAHTLDPQTVMLVNDIDLRIEDPLSAIHYPWVLDPQNPSAAATTGDNFRDNVEQILIQNPQDGTYKIRITAKGNIVNEPQIVSIIISSKKQSVVLSSPGNGYNQILTSPKLIWNTLPGVTKYWVQVSTSANFGNIVYEQKDIVNTNAVASGLKECTQYFWRVKYSDNSGDGEWSDVWSFTTGALPTNAGNAIRFDGVDDYIEVPSNTKFNSIESEDKLTIEAWIYINKFSSGIFPITDFHITADDFGWSFFVVESAGLELNLLYSSLKAIYNFELGKWYHVAVSCDKAANKIMFFVNGSKISESTFADDIPDTQQFGTPMLIGANLSGGDEYADGVIDELRIWSIARSEYEIKNNICSVLTGIPTGLVANFNFNSANGLNVPDASGNIDGGNLKDNPTWVISNAPYSIPAIPELLSPQKDENNVLVQPTFRWLHVTAASKYRLQVSLNTGFSNVISDNSELTDNSAIVNNLQYKTKYYWRVCAENMHGNGQWSPSRSFTTASLVGIEDERNLPHEFNLYQNYPNPFNPNTIIKFQIPVSQKVSLKIYDVLGRETATLIDEMKDPGIYEVVFNGSELPSGIYFYRISTGDFVQTKKMVLIK